MYVAGKQRWTVYPRGPSCQGRSPKSRRLQCLAETIHAFLVSLVSFCVTEASAMLLVLSYIDSISMCHLFEFWRYVVTHVLIVIPNLT